MDLRALVELLLALTAGSWAWRASSLERCRRRDADTVDRLQRALATDVPAIAGVGIDCVVSASAGTTVGGDLVDVFEIDARFALLLIADVAGRGVAAAAQTAFIKYTIRTLALESDGDPAVIVAKFNAIYARTIRDREAFVVLVLGILDTQTGEVRYTSAGHEPAYLRRRDGDVTWLAPTGPIVGAAPYAAYGSRRVTLGDGDALVLTTDGVTESRDRQGRLLGAEGLAAWLSVAPAHRAGLADWLLRELRARSGRAEADDVALLAVSYDAVAARAPRTLVGAD